MSAPAAKKQKVEEGAIPLDEAEEKYANLLNEAAELQSSLEKIDESAAEAVIDLENKCNKDRIPLQKQRAEKLKQIPFFWTKLVTAFPPYQDANTDADDLLVALLISVECYDLEDLRQGWDLVFEFHDKSDLFDNSTLRFTKTIRRSGMDKGAPTIMHQTTPKPKWKPGKNPFSAEDRKKLRIGEEAPAFFGWFFGDGTEKQEDEDSPFQGCAEDLKNYCWADPLTVFNDEEQEFHGDSDDDDDDDEDDEEPDEGAE